MTKYFDVISLLENGGGDDEANDLIHEFFWRKTGGIVMELGALDGSLFLFPTQSLYYPVYKLNRC